MKLSTLFQAKSINPLYCKLTLFVFFYLISSLSVALISGCAPSKRFTSEDEKRDVASETSGGGTTVFLPEAESKISYDIRVLLNEYKSSKKFLLETSAKLYSGNNQLALINKGNEVNVSISQIGLEITIQGKTFTSNQFIINPVDDQSVLKIDSKRYRGRILFTNSGNSINLVNQITLEDYVKGVMTKEMPLGKGLEHYEALKAFAICARTYAYTKIFEGKVHFDILPDTRDQVYGGVDAETEYSNRVVDETRNLILTYENKPAIIFYHSTCGGFTEDALNVFTKANVPYLKSIRDGSSANCSISPRFEWTEYIPQYRIIDRLNKTGHISGKDFIIRQINVNSRFDSGRINELEFVLSSGNKEQRVRLYGNNIRSIIRTADDSSILRSNFFDVQLSNDKTVIIKGKGNGHGVGMCQWGAIGLSRNGVDYKTILNHYYPGTEIKSIK